MKLEYEYLGNLDPEDFERVVRNSLKFYKGEKEKRIERATADLEAFLEDKYFDDFEQVFEAFNLGREKRKGPFYSDSGKKIRGVS